MEMLTLKVAPLSPPYPNPSLKIVKELCISLRSPCFAIDCEEKKQRKLREKRIKQLESKMEERWDFLCTAIGFDEKGLEVQDGIKEFITWKFELEGLKK